MCGEVCVAALVMKVSSSGVGVVTVFFALCCGTSDEEGGVEEGEWEEEGERRRGRRFVGAECNGEMLPCIEIILWYCKWRVES